MKYYSLLKVNGKRQNYFMKTNIPIRNQEQAKNFLISSYKEDFTENNLNIKDIKIYPLGIIKFYYGILLNKIYS